MALRTLSAERCGCRHPRKASVPVPQRGSILILALWTLFFLAALALAVGAHVSAALKLAAFLNEDVQGYHLARAGVTHAALQVACNTNQWDALTEDAWNADPSVFSDQQVADVGTFSIINLLPTEDGMVTNVGLVSVNSMLDLNDADKSVLESFFVRVGGVSLDKAESLYNAIQKYREMKQAQLLSIRASRGDDVSEIKDEKAELESVYELFLVNYPLEDNFFAAIEPYITVFGSRNVDPNTVSEVILECFVDAYPKAREGVEKTIAERKEGKIFKSRPYDLGFFNCVPEAFYGMVIGHPVSGGEDTRIEFVVDSRGQRQYWHEF